MLYRTDFLADIDSALILIQISTDLLIFSTDFLGDRLDNDVPMLLRQKV